jgi:hypothetical protein
LSRLGQLVDEQDDLTLAVLDVLEHRLEALLELAPELGTGDDRTEVERDHPLVLQSFRHVAADDPLGEPFDDRRLADPRLADQDGVVLGPSREHLDDPTDLVVPADDGIELAGSCLGGEVPTVLLQRLVGPFGVR